MRPKESLVLKTCRKPKLSNAAAIIHGDRVRGASGVATANGRSNGRYVTLEICSLGDLEAYGSPTHSITVVNAKATSMWMSPIWPRLRATTRTALSPWPYDWWWRTACPTGQPVGISGETTGCLSPLPPSRTGWSPGGKKAEQHVAAEYVDAVPADFSGYIAADELYDGPFCVLSIVDKRTYRRILYEVLDHDPCHSQKTHLRGTR